MGLFDNKPLESIEFETCPHGTPLCDDCDECDMDNLDDDDTEYPD